MPAPIAPRASDTSDEAARVQRAVEQDIAAREGSRSTSEIGDAVIALLQA